MSQFLRLPTALASLLISFALVGCYETEANNSPKASSAAAEVSATSDDTAVEPEPIKGERYDAMADFDGPVLKLHVDPTSAPSENSFTTLKAAFERISATRASAAGANDPSYTEPAIHLTVSPGIYREGALTILESTTPITIESSDPAEEVVISGADVWTDWQQSGEFLRAKWPYKWGDYSLNGWPPGELRELQEVGKRSEMVFVNGKLLRQVMAGQELKRGQFAVDLEKETLTLRLPRGVDAQNAMIEVSTRPNLMFVGPTPGLTLRDLVFTQANNSDTHQGFGSWAVLIAGEADTPSGGAPILVDEDRNFIRNILIEDCRFEWNNHGGLTMANVIGLRVFDSSFNNNGSSGAGVNRGKDVLWEDCTFDANNWRIGKWGKTYGWAPAGTKQLFMADTTFRRCTFNRNYATGLWMDFGNERILIEDCEMAENWYVGFYFEASLGPCLVKDSIIARNAISEKHDFATGGVLFAESKNLTLENNIIADNANWQIGVRSRERESSGYWSKVRYDGLCEHLIVNNNLIRGGYYAPSAVPEWFGEKHRISTLIGASTHSNQEWYKKLIPTYVGDNNTFVQGNSLELFSEGGDYGLDRVTLTEWQEMTGQDLNSKHYANTPR